MKTWQIVILVLIVAIGGFVTTPLIQKTKALTAQRDALEVQREKKVSELNELKQAMEDLSNETLPTDALTQVPLSHDQDALIQDLIRITKATGFGFTGMNFAKGTNAQVGASELTAAFNVQGTREQLIRFLSEIEKNPRFMGIERLNISTSFVGNTPIVNFSISLYSFFQE